MSGKNKLEAGAVYSLEREDGSKEEFICWATLDRKGQRFGWIQRFGLGRQTVQEGTEIVNQMKKVVKRVSAKKTAPSTPAKEKGAPPKKTTRRKSTVKARM